MIIVTLGLKCVSDLQASRQQRPLLMYVTVGDLITHSGFKGTSDYGGYLDMSSGVFPWIFVDILKMKHWLCY